MQKKYDKSKEKMDSDISALLADFDLAKKVKTDLSLRNDDGEIKSTEDMFGEALKSVDSEIKLDSLDVGYMRGMLTVHADNESMKRQRGTNMDSQNSDISFAELQKRQQQSEGK